MKFMRKNLIVFFSFVFFLNCNCGFPIPKLQESIIDSGQIGDGILKEQIHNEFPKENKIELNSLCEEGKTRKCYDGRKVGGRWIFPPCLEGEQICRLGTWGRCEGQNLPSPENCNGIDDDCNGHVDDTPVLTPSCYTGSPSSKDVGLCFGGHQLCIKGKSSFCINDKTPAAEICDQEDNNCNGEVDEGNICDGIPNPKEEVFVKGGEFLLGSNQTLDSFAAPPETPTVKTYLSSFFIDKYEVTNKDYKQCVSSGHCSKIKEPSLQKGSFPSDYFTNRTYDLFPVVFVTWHQARSYCLWRKKDLPTETQWERSAKGTIKKREWMRFPWGHFSPKSCLYSNIHINNNLIVSGKYLGESHFPCTPHPARIGAYKKDITSDGVFDMGGNVSEWTRDCYENFWYASSQKFEDPVQLSCEKGIGPQNTLRVVRGGNFEQSQRNARTTLRRKESSESFLEWVGFRCARKSIR